MTSQSKANCDFLSRPEAMVSIHIVILILLVDSFETQEEIRHLVTYPNTPKPALSQQLHTVGYFFYFLSFPKTPKS